MRSNRMHSSIEKLPYIWFQRGQTLLALLLLPLWRLTAFNCWRKINWKPQIGIARSSPQIAFSNLQLSVSQSPSSSLLCISVCIITIIIITIVSITFFYICLSIPQIAVCSLCSVLVEVEACVDWLTIYVLMCMLYMTCRCLIIFSKSFLKRF